MDEYAASASELSRLVALVAGARQGAVDRHALAEVALEQSHKRVDDAGVVLDRARAHLKELMATNGDTSAAEESEAQAAKQFQAATDARLAVRATVTNASANLRTANVLFDRDMEPARAAEQQLRQQLMAATTAAVAAESRRAAAVAAYAVLQEEEDAARRIADYAAMHDALAEVRRRQVDPLRACAAAHRDHSAAAAIAAALLAVPLPEVPLLNGTR